MKKSLLCVLLMLLATVSFAQDFLPPCVDRVYSNKVKTVQLYAYGEQTNEPLVGLDNMMYQLTLSFDVLSNDAEVFNYTFIHCTNDWKPTDIQRIKYIDGFESDNIDNYAFSLNTLVDYVHYEMNFPNANMRPTLSGNYLLIVYSDDELTADNLLFTRRFMVLDEHAFLDVRVPRYSNRLDLSDTHQQLDVRVVMPDIALSNVQDYAHLTVRQNGRWDNAVCQLSPSYVYPDYISYENNDKLVFEACNQYRRFNTSNLKYQSENIAYIRQLDPHFLVAIEDCSPRARKPFVTHDDINGEKFIYIEGESYDNGTEADYVLTDFFFRYNPPLTHEDVYLLGAISDWHLDDNNRMKYDYDAGGYRCDMLLKQGYYNFMIVTADKDVVEPVAHTDITEGNFWETQNIYRLYFYYYNMVKGYDELIGYSLIKSH